MGNMGGKPGNFFPLLFLTLTVLFGNCVCENILFFTNNFATADNLHGLQVLAQKLVTARDHHVTIFTLYADNIQSKSNPNPRITYYYPDSLRELHQNATEIAHHQELESRLLLKYVARMAGHHRQSSLESNYKFCASLLENPEFLSWLKQQKHQGKRFDLVLIDKSYEVGNECGYGISSLFSAKTISYSSSGTLAIWEYVMYGIPPETWWLPSGESFYQTNHMPFIERLSNLYYAVTNYLNYKHNHLPRMETLLKRSFPAINIKPLKKMIQDDSLYLLNHHYSGDFAKSYPPFVIPVGGMQLTTGKAGKVPQNILSFINTDPFVYIYFGPDKDLSKLPEETIQMFLTSVSSFPKIKFIWSWGNGRRPATAVPKNLLISQERVTPGVLKAIFGLQRMKLFISNGDQENLQYAVHYGIPLLVIPLSGHQEINAKRTRQFGNGLDIDLYDVSNQTLNDALTSLFNEQRYFEAASSLAKASQNRPMTSLDTAFWWLQFALESDDLSYLKPVSIHQPWWTTFSFDVHLTLFFIASVVLALLSSLIYLCYLSRRDNYILVKDSKKGR